MIEDEDEVQISPARKKLLEDIRKEDNNESDINVSGRPFTVGKGGFVTPPPRNQGVDGRNQGGAQRDASPPRIAQRPGERVRPSDRPRINPVESVSVSDRGREEPLGFKLKWPFAKKEPSEPAKLFSNAEAERNFEHLKDIYFRGSGFLDDILEIVVKDHEPVQIWQLSEEESIMLAMNHLDRAKVDEGAARSARVLLDIYDRIYFWMVVYPRAKLTGQHVIKHGGLSFK
jgi:hypothetical protein